MKYRLGIDVGGTNTDAVIIDEDLNVIAQIKVLTTQDVYTGIMNAVRSVVSSSNINRRDITMAMLGTTQCTNAIVERKNLVPVGILRIGAPATTGIQPMTDWPDDLKKVAYKSTVVKGGYEYDGKELNPLDEDACRAFFEDIRGHVDSVAISGVFSTLRNEQEVRAGEIAREVLGDDVHVSLSSEIGSMGLIERENATILNAALNKVAKAFTEGFARSLKEEGLENVSLYLSQNDGTLMSIEEARRYPVLTIACGPTNSIRGASYLTKVSNAIIVDVGGTTTDIGALQNGFPRESGVAVTIGGVRTNFRMPDVVSIGLGGGSIVRLKDDGSVTVGPDSVGYRITQEALVFGGNTLTATDIAVRLGLADIGDKSLVENISKETALKALNVIKSHVEDAIDSMKLSSNDVTVILAGGGSVIIPSELKGASEVIVPQYSGCANAIGSAISKVSGYYEKLVSYDEIPREQAIKLATNEAILEATRSGARMDSVEIVEIEDVPLQYYPGNMVRIRIKAAGDLA